MQRLALAVLWASMVPLLASCTIPREITKTARSAIEQLLLAEALNRSLLDVALPLSVDESLYMEVTGLQLGYLSPLVPLTSVAATGGNKYNCDLHERLFFSGQRSGIRQGRRRRSSRRIGISRGETRRGRVVSRPCRGAILRHQSIDVIFRHAADTKRAHSLLITATHGLSKSRTGRLRTLWSGGDRSLHWPSVLFHPVAQSPHVP